MKNPEKTEPVEPPKETEPVRNSPPPVAKREKKWSPIVIAVAIVALILAIGIGGRLLSQNATPAKQPAQTISMETFVMAEPDYTSATTEYSYFWGQSRYTRRTVRTITFRSALAGIPSNAWTWDVSKAGDGSVIAWMDGNNLHVAADGKIVLNPDSSHMFDQFTNLRKISWGEAVDTSQVTDMSEMFYGCSCLTSLDLSHFDTSNVENMDFMFFGCSSLTSLDVCSFDTSNVENMDGMFRGCNSMTNLDVSGFDTSDVTNMSNMFDGCSSLTSLDVSGFDTSDVTNMNSMFRGCNSMTNLNVTGFDTSNVTDMSWMFFNCRSLTSLNLRYFDESNVMRVDGMFDGCDNLTSLQCPNRIITATYRMRR